MSPPRCQRCTPPAQVAAIDSVVTFAGVESRLVLCHAHAEIFAAMLSGWTRRKVVLPRRRSLTPEGRTTVHRLRTALAAQNLDGNLDGSAQRNRSSALG